MKKVFWLGAAAVVLLSVQSMALEYGADLLNGDGSFEFDGGTGPWNCWADGTEISVISNVLPFEGIYSWQAGPSVASGKNFRAVYNNDFSVVGNRKYAVVYRYRIGASTPSWFEVRMNTTQVRLGTMYRSAYYSASFIYTTAADETLISNLELATYSNSATDAVYIDNLTIARERTLPRVGGDSREGVLVNGRANTVMFRTIVMPGADTVNAGLDESGLGATATIAFDPDIAISAANATVSNIQWISDSEVSADITPSSTGTVALTFNNVYSNYSYVYAMTSVTPPTSCGGAGTEYLPADINRDCKVTLLDFATFGAQWMRCTAMDADPVNCGF